MSMSGMDMSGASTAMSGMSMATTATAAASSTSSTAMSSMSMGGDCKISMLWNWYTVDTCFLSSSWHVTSTGMFAGSCIGVVLLVIALEFLRRLGREYDRYLLRTHTEELATMTTAPSPSSSSAKGDSTTVLARGVPAVRRTFRPTVLQQGVRALLHMLAFAVAYFVMLLAMYYNGYIIICIFIGAFLGFFIFGWEAVSLAGPEEETTVCCG